MRKIGLDYGDARIGIALTDRTNLIASPYEVYATRGWTKDVAYLSSLIVEKEVDTIVMGDPVNMDGTSGERCKIVREFGDRLAEATGLPVVYMDERLTTVEMEEFLAEQGVPKKKYKLYIDKLSAQLILKNYLEAEEFKRRRSE